LLLVRPDPVRRVLAPHSPSPGLDSTVLRVLGARHVAQGVVTALFPTRRVLTVGAVVDTLHAASMVGLAVLDSDRRRPGLLDASLAGSFAAASARAAAAED
jgi:hypothetical protein